MPCNNPKFKCTICTKDKCNCDGTKECSCYPELGSCCCNN